MDVLVVEDSLRERERLKSLFDELGYSVNSCDSVQQAEEYLRHELVKLVILDIGLTDRSGSVLFQTLRSIQPACRVIIFTGNPSPYLKQRFLKEGAVHYVVKGSEGASNEAFQRMVQDLIGDPQSSLPQVESGTNLTDFLRDYIAPNSRALFYDASGEFPPCTACGSRKYVVTFAHEIQVPPLVQGKVCCEGCGAPLDPSVGDDEAN
ncbi:MAG: response regulator [Bdellovibrionales bacterium]|nr:response regulator [Bdellovibrionales bacterium]